MQAADFDMISTIKAIAICLTSENVKLDSTHQHRFAQLYCLKHGQMMIQSSTGIIVTPPHCMGWIPSYCEHHIISNSGVTGWTVFIDESLATIFPKEPTILSCSFLLEPLIQRMAEWEMAKMEQREYQHLVNVFFDELKQAELQPLSLPIPQDARLKKIALYLLENPTDEVSLEDLAQSNGLSTRSLSRHWSNHVGMSIKKYRQIAKIFKSLDDITAGKSIEQCAWRCGFESTSAYILAFKRIFKTTPKEYQNLVNLNITKNILL